MLLSKLFFLEETLCDNPTYCVTTLTPTTVLTSVTGTVFVDSPVRRCSCYLPLQLFTPHHSLLLLETSFETRFTADDGADREWRG